MGPTGKGSVKIGIEVKQVAFSHRFYSTYPALTL